MVDQIMDKLSFAVLENAIFGIIVFDTELNNIYINKKIETDAQQRNDIALTPLAIPMLAGPGSISLLIAFYQEHHSSSEIVISSLAIFAIAIAIFVILRSAHYLAKILGASGIVAISRIVGFIVIAIGIQYIVSAMVNIIKGNLL